MAPPCRRSRSRTPLGSRPSLPSTTTSGHPDRLDGLPWAPAMGRQPREPAWLPATTRLRLTRSPTSTDAACPRGWTCDERSPVKETTERDLAAGVSTLTGRAPARGLVEVASLLVVGERPEDALAEDRATQVIEGRVHESATHATAPSRGRDGDCVEFSEVRFDRIATRSSPHEADDRSAALREAPPHEPGVQVSRPASNLLWVEHARRHQIREPRVPRLDVHPGDPFGVGWSRLAQVKIHNNSFAVTRTHLPLPRPASQPHSDEFGATICTWIPRT
jgi:hypothetical protein